VPPIDLNDISLNLQLIIIEFQIDYCFKLNKCLQPI
jgi:ABC-type iron transport system FetAB permease component